MSKNETLREQMKIAYTRFLQHHECGPELINECLNDKDVVDNLVELYKDSQEDYGFEKDADLDEIENMKKFLFHVEDVDMGGISENIHYAQEKLDQKNQ